MAELRSYNPTLRDQIARLLMGSSQSMPARNFVGGLLGSTGLGQSGMGLVDFTPLGVPMQMQEAARAGDYQGMALSAMPGGGAAKGAMKGLGRAARNQREAISSLELIYNMHHATGKTDDEIRSEFMKDLQAPYTPPSDLELNLRRAAGDKRTIDEINAENMQEHQKAQQKIADFINTKWPGAL